MDYIAFYWTLPVNRIGFTELPKNPDEAAVVSRTIRYQVERVRRWVKDDDGRLVKEVTFMETRPDRGTDAIRDEIAKLLAQAIKLKAQLVLVDFAQAFGWRPHGPLFDMIGDESICVRLSPEPALMDGKWWDPVNHFRAWREVDEAHQIAKETLKDKALSAMSDLKSEGATYTAIAAHLNDVGWKTVNGRVWTADNVRKFMAQG